MSLYRGGEERLLQLLPLRLAIQFFTRIPVGSTPVATDRQLGASVSWYPLVGLLIGLIIGATALISIQIFGPQVSAVLTLLIWVVVTGGLHLDGLADCADAWMGGFGSKERTLALLKDPTCGPMAVIAVVLLLLLKYAALLEILLLSSQQTGLQKGVVLWMLAIPPVVGRLSGTVLMATTPCSHQKGLGWAVSQYMSVHHVCVWLILGAAIGLLICPLSLLTIFAVSALLLFGVRAMSLERIDGYTGDVVGALIECAEVLTLLVLLALLI